MTIKIGVIMDPIHEIHFKKDTTIALLLAAQQRGWELFYMEQPDCFARDGVASAYMRHLTVYDDPQHWFEFQTNLTQPMHQLDVILMRKDPPFDMDYIFTTYLLELAEQKNILVVNSPQSLRDANEKMFISWFPQCCPPTLVSSNIEALLQFTEEQKEIVVKPLDAMGGQSIFHLRKNDDNNNVILEDLTQRGKRLIMAQTFIQAIKQGDKRIIMINGEPIPYALVRIPPKNDFRGNLAKGATAKVVKINERDQWICQQIGPTLIKKGILFAGIDVIGDYLTEINLTSPTCIREIENETNMNIAKKLIDQIQSKLTT